MRPAVVVTLALLLLAVLLAGSIQLYFGVG